jgi:hypothetical protein
MALLNIVSLSKHIDEIRLLLENQTVDILALNEKQDFTLIFQVNLLHDDPHSLKKCNFCGLNTQKSGNQNALFN